MEWVGGQLPTTGLSGDISQTQTPLVVFAGLSQSFFFPAAANSQPRFAGQVLRSLCLILFTTYLWSFKVDVIHTIGILFHGLCDITGET